MIQGYLAGWIALCDDDPSVLESLNTIIHDYEQNRNLKFGVRLFLNGESLLDALHKGDSFDLIFLDIYLAETNGMDVARKIRAKNIHSSLVFVTSSQDFALESYGVKALTYLLKPVESEAVYEAVNRAFEKKDALPPPCIQIRNKDGLHGIPIDQLMYAESQARILILVLKDKEAMRTYEKLDQFQEKLGDNRFLRCHKSFLVNLDHVHAIVGKTMLMKSGTALPISISLPQAKEYFANYLARKL